MSKRIGRDRKLFNIVGYSVCAVIAAVSLMPFLLILAGSFTKEQAIYQDGFRLIPRQVSIETYEFIFKVPQDYLRSFGLTVFVTATGTAAGLLLVTMSAFVILQKDFRPRNMFSFYFYFTSIFRGGMVPSYILMVRYLHLRGSVLALILPIMVNAWYIIIMRSFMTSVPDAIADSAKIDGAGYFTIFAKLYLPLSIPAIATIGMFIALGYWNDWYHSMLYADREALYTLQYLLYRVVNVARALDFVQGDVPITLERIPTESLKLATTVVTIVPIFCLYPFVQRYFIKGLTVGAVKG